MWNISSVFSMKIWDDKVYSASSTFTYYTRIIYHLLYVQGTTKDQKENKVPRFTDEEWNFQPVEKSIEENSCILIQSALTRFSSLLAFIGFYS